MCGIAGIYHFGNSGCVEEAVLTRMRDTMVHRGPDGGANWIAPDRKVGLGHRRLSIIDLSASADQPMCNEDRTVWTTFNGEIYNHAGLRAELVAAGHRFATDHSDTEVLVHGYEEWGAEGLVQRIGGDFGVAIWDARKRVMSLFRDRTGVKPLYFYLKDGLLLFASEIKAILAHPAVRREVDPRAMYHYLSFMTTPAPMTMFQNIFKLPVAHYAQIYADGRFEAVRYWDAVPGQAIDPAEIRGLSDRALEEFYVKGIRQRLREAVEVRMMSDVPFGVFLSGGVDSSTNVALMNEFTNRPLETFTVGFKDFPYLNELNYARIVADKFKTNHHEVLIDESDMIGYLDDLVYHQDEPIADWVCIPLYFVSKLAHDSGIRVIQVGEGSDEQFCGYSGYMRYLEIYRKFWRPFQSLLPKSAQRGAAWMARELAGLRPSFDVYADFVDRAARDRELFWGGAMVFWDLMKDQCLNAAKLPPPEMSEAVCRSGLLPRNYYEADSFNVVRSFLEPFDAQYPGCDVLTRMIHTEFRLRLPELLLMRVDKVGMSVSLEARVPFLDHKLVEFSMDIPMEWKTRNGTSKYLLKKAVEGLIPDELIHRKKMGFGAPMSDWLKGSFGRHVQQVIGDSALIKRDYFNLEYINRLFEMHRRGHDPRACTRIWVLFNLAAWYDCWIERRQARVA